MKAVIKFRSILLALVAVLALSLTLVSTGLAQDGLDEEKLQRGATLYNENCVMCHGPNGEGRIGATLNQDWPSIRPDLAIANTITNGVPGSLMPAWGESKGGPLSDEQIDDVVYYIMSWETNPGHPYVIPTQAPLPPIEPVPGVEGDPNNGAILFLENCAVCHGQDGHGRIGTSLAKSWPSIRPDLSVKATISSGVPGSLMPAWSEEKGGPLTEANINDVTAFIMTLESDVTEAGMPTAAPISDDSDATGSAGGLILAIVIFAGIVGVILYLQRPRK